MFQQLIYEAAARLGFGFDFDTVETAGRRLGDLMWRVLKKRRAMASAAVAQRLGKYGEDAERIARESFRQSATSFLEILITRKVDWRFVHDRLTMENPIRFKRIFDCGRPVIAVSGHFGAWELMTGIFGLHVIGKPAQIVVRRYKDHAMDGLTRHLRGQPGVTIVPHRNAMRKVLRCMKDTGVTAFLVDHNTRTREAVFLPFLGKAAAVNMGPALIAARSEALVVPVFLYREGGGRYRLRVEQALDPLSLKGERQEKIKQIATFYTKAVERQVLQRPDLWFWMHRRWKTRPPHAPVPEESTEMSGQGEEQPGK